MIIISYTYIYKILPLCPEHPKRDKYPKFTILSETTSIPVCFIWESPPPPGRKSWRPRAELNTTQSLSFWNYDSLTTWRTIWVFVDSVTLKCRRRWKWPRKAYCTFQIALFHLKLSDQLKTDFDSLQLASIFFALTVVKYIGVCID